MYNVHKSPTTPLKMTNWSGQFSFHVTALIFLSLLSDLYHFPLSIYHFLCLTLFDRGEGGELTNWNWQFFFPHDFISIALSLSLLPFRFLSLSVPYLSLPPLNLIRWVGGGGGARPPKCTPAPLCLFMKVSYLSQEHLPKYILKILH